MPTKGLLKTNASQFRNRFKIVKNFYNNFLEADQVLEKGIKYHRTRFESPEMKCNSSLKMEFAAKPRYV